MDIFWFCRFLVKKGTPGYRATKIENKIGLRMVQNGDIVMKDVYVSDEDRLTGINSFQDTNKVTSNEDDTLCGVLHALKYLGP